MPIAFVLRRYRAMAGHQAHPCLQWHSMKPLLKTFQASGLNNQFHGGEGLPFADYIEKTRQMIAQARVDLTPATAEKTLNANTPYEWPSANPGKQGVLLVHGLYDSPFTLKDLGNHFSTQGLLVRSVLLPGHGTIPGDLLNVHYSEWVKAVDYGVETLAQEVDQLFIVGFSLGGVLALHKALLDTRIKGILLISPALALQSQWWVGQLVRWHKWVAWALPEGEWYKKRDFQHDYTKYESFTCNAGVQIYQLVLKTGQLLRQSNLSIPVFLTISAEDEVVCPKACLAFFASNTHPSSRLLWYTREPQTFQDARIRVENSSLPAQKIIDFSHTCLPISPDNPHYGATGDYQDFLAYPGNKSPAQQEIFLGAVSKANLKKHTIQRLSYNPDFKRMVEESMQFLNSL